MALLERFLQPDPRPTMAEWPKRIWSKEEFPDECKEYVLRWMKRDFSEYSFVFAPGRSSCKTSFPYLFGYGGDDLLYLTQGESGIRVITMKQSDITTIKTSLELLNAKITVSYRSDKAEQQIEFPYVPSTYYLYDPFLNWLLGIDKEFLPSVAESHYPRPQKLYEESLVMFNFSLHAYRLGNGFEDYRYRYEIHRPKWAPWKKKLEEWLEVPMERGLFRLYHFGYKTECEYILSR